MLDHTRLEDQPSDLEIEFDGDFGGCFRATGIADEEPPLPQVADGLADACDDLRNQLDAAKAELAERLTIAEVIEQLEHDAPGEMFGVSMQSVGYAGPLPMGMKGSQSQYEIRWLIGGGKHCHVFKGDSWREVLNRALSAACASDEPLRAA